MTSVVLLGELGAAVKHACVGGPFGSELTRKDYRDAGVPVIRGSNLNEEAGFIDDGFVFVSDEKADSLRQNLAARGDVIFTQRGTIGQVAAIPPNARYERYLLSQSQMKITPDPKRVEARYIVHYFRSPAALHFLERNTLATGVPHINLSILRRVPVPLPSVLGQRRIADILDKADSVRRKRKEAIALIEELLRSAFLEMFGDPVTNPKGWPVRRLGEVASTTSGGTPSRARPDFFGGGIPWVKSGELHQELVLETEETLSELGVQSSSAKLMPRGTVLIAMYGATVGAVATLGVRATTNQAVCCVTPGKGLCPEYLVGLLRLITHVLLEQRVGGAQPNLSQELVRAVPVPLPPMEVQSRFARLREHVDPMRTRARSAESLTMELSGALAQRAFRGELGAA